MLTMQFAFGLFLIKSIFFCEAYGQCNGEPKLIFPGSGHIKTRPRSNIRRDEQTHCSWQLGKPLNKEYIIMLYTKMMSKLYVNDGTKCATNISLNINSERIRCKDFIDPTKTNCKAYYSSPSCKTLLPQYCKASKRASFPLPISVEFQNIELKKDFKIFYKYVECPSANCPGDDADCGVAVTGSGTDANVQANMTIDTVTQTTTHSLAITSINEPHLNLDSRSTVTKPVSQPSLTLANACGRTNWPIFVFVLGSVVLILLLIVVVLLILLIRSRRQSKVATPTAFYQNCETSVVALESEVTSEAPRQVEYVNLSSINRQEIENPYEIPIRQNAHA